MFFNELPGFFDRNFIVAYFLPALIFVMVGFALMVNFDIAPALREIISSDLYKGATIIGVISWIIAVLLLSLNFNLIRFFEGYGKYNPLKILRPVYVHKLFRIEEKKVRLKDAKTRAEASENFVEAADIQVRRNELHRYAAEHFPPKRSRVLSTAFGNAVRAFEDYSETMYGIDAIISWVRLLAVIPKDFREMLNSARAQVDMWINFWGLAYFLIAAYFFIIFFTGQIKMIWFPVVVAGAAYLASKRAVGAAILWGDFVKSSYDLYLPDLKDQIRLPETKTAEQEKILWKNFAIQVIYHSEDHVLKRVSNKKSADGSKEKSASDEE